MTKPEALVVQDRNTYTLTIGDRGFTIQFDESDDDAVLMDARSMILGAARDLMGCVRKAGPDVALDDSPNRGVELLVGLAAALDSEIQLRQGGSVQ
jgi:hypothetical protein